MSSFVELISGGPYWLDSDWQSGVVVTGTESTEPGIRGEALTLRTGTTLSVDPGLTASTGSWSGACWARRDRESGTNEQFAGILSRINGNSADTASLTYRPGNLVRLLLPDEFSLTHEVTTDQWHHYAIVYSADDGTATIYVDGVAVRIENIPPSSADSARAFSFGMNGDRGLYGAVDECVYSPTAWTSAEVAELFAGHEPLPLAGDVLSLDGSTLRIETPAVFDSFSNGPVVISRDILIDGTAIVTGSTATTIDLAGSPDGVVTTAATASNSGGTSLLSRIASQNSVNYASLSEAPYRIVAEAAVSVGGALAATAELPAGAVATETFSNLWSV